MSDGNGFRPKPRTQAHERLELSLGRVVVDLGAALYLLREQGAVELAERAARVLEDASRLHSEGRALWD
jgi:hypothetical protein